MRPAGLSPLLFGGLAGLALCGRWGFAEEPLALPLQAGASAASSPDGQIVPVLFKSGPTGVLGSSKRIIIHVAQPEVVCEEPSAPEEPAKSERHGLFRKRARPAAAPAIPFVASILAPAPAMVPMVPAGAPCGSGPNQGAGVAPGMGADFSALRAAQDLEIAVSRLVATKAALDVQARGFQASLERIGKRVAAQLPSPGTDGGPQGVAPPPGAAAPPPTDIQQLAHQIEGIRIKLDLLDKLVNLHNQQLTKHQEVLIEKHPDKAGFLKGP